MDLLHQQQCRVRSCCLEAATGMGATPRARTCIHPLLPALIPAHPEQQQEKLCPGCRATHKPHGLRSALKYLRAFELYRIKKKSTHKSSFYPFATELSNQIDCTFQAGVKPLSEQSPLYPLLPSTFFCSWYRNLWKEVWGETDNLETSRAAWHWRARLPELRIIDRF